MPDLFENILRRLKQETGLRTDKEIAALLGIGEKAFNARKTRGSFPADKLMALAGKNPALQIDLHFVLEGKRPPPIARERTAALYRFAGSQRMPEDTEATRQLLRAELESFELRQPLFDTLTALAAHCDDAHLTLLITVAEAFKKATAQAARDQK